jgi:hypothetical protein
MVGAYAPPAVHSPDTSAICGQKNELNFHKAVSDDRYVRHDGSVCATRRTQPRHQRYLRTKE